VDPAPVATSARSVSDDPHVEVLPSMDAAVAPIVMPPAWPETVASDASDVPEAIDAELELVGVMDCTPFRIR